ncbi:hypothetical protein [Streptomyces colonosanans]|uniref:Uncharacterized protein n=1 Tax=Streptomyces colonosanans TaxID=1428652 RepID=A0A1S2PCP9_9ACTN|nr:hypothetical protein [Streptomyces colonosanans]OIJ91619.1 hypothetical protein BIV24_15255 [Streptomyces colonosanans]
MRHDSSDCGRIPKLLNSSPVGNRADEYGTEVEIYRRARPPALHADAPTGAPSVAHPSARRSP